MKMPLWSRDEYILILELYLRFRETAPSKADPVLEEYSNYLRSMQPQISEQFPKYRNRNGVYLRLMNYRSCDPFWTEQGKVGMAAGKFGKCKEIWDEFSGDAETVNQLAGEIKSEIAQAQGESHQVLQTPEQKASKEGKRRLRVHYSRERTSQRKQKIAQVISQKNSVECEACEATQTQYSGLKEHVIFEVHHIIPLAKTEDEVETKLEDLAVLCANCHRAIHAIEPIPTVNEFRSRFFQK